MQKEITTIKEFVDSLQKNGFDVIAYYSYKDYNFKSVEIFVPFNQSLTYIREKLERLYYDRVLFLDVYRNDISTIVIDVEFYE